MSNTNNSFFNVRLLQFSDKYFLLQMQDLKGIGESLDMEYSIVYLICYEFTMIKQILYVLMLPMYSTYHHHLVRNPNPITIF